MQAGNRRSSLEAHTEDLISKLQNHSLLDPYFLRKTLSTQMRARQKLTKAFRLFVFMCCTVFTGFQTYKCLEKYQSTPRGTSMILTSPSKLQDFPAITLCPKLKGFGGKSKDCTVFNGTKLKECDIFIELPKGNRRG